MAPLSGNHAKTRSVTLAIMFDGKVEMTPVSGYAAGPGLAVHREAQINGHGLRILKTWAVTHAPSGRRIIGKLRTRSQALKAASSMRRIKGVDWALPFEGGNDPFTAKTFGFVGLGRKVKAIEKRVRND